MTRWCQTCDRPDRDLALERMAEAVPGSVGYYSAMSAWSPEPCQCAEPDWDEDDE